MTPGIKLEFRDFRPGDEAAFRGLNEEWIVRYFKMEPKDEESLGNPRKIVDRGGNIFFAFAAGKPIGCCALVAIRPGEFEVAKMAVTEQWQGRGIGRQLLEKTITGARVLGARRLFLETNSKLTPAIRLYESLGFQHLPPERVAPSPYARSNVSMELELV